VNVSKYESEDREPETFRKGDVQAALAELRDTFVAGVAAKNADGTPVQVVAVADGMSLKSLKPLLDEYLHWPERARGYAELSNVASLARYVNLHKRPESIVYLDDLEPGAPRMVAVFDANEPRPQPPPYQGDPADPEAKTKAEAHAQAWRDKAPGVLAGWQEFGAVYRFPLSPEWIAWARVAGQWLKQAEFAQFLEEHALEVVDATNPGARAKQITEQLGLELAGPARLLELSRGLSVNVAQAVTNEIKLSSGEGQIHFEEKHVDKGGALIRVPGAFAIDLPVFRGGAPYRVVVFLRYRVVDKRIAWQLSPYLLDRVFDDALQGAAEQVENATGIPVVRGRPDPITTARAFARY
jgi:hypothetical protein